MFCCEVIVTVFDRRVVNRPLSLYVYYKWEKSLLHFKGNGTAKAGFSFFVFCRGQQNLLRVWSHGADHQGKKKKKQFLFSLVHFLLLVFYKRKHLEIGPTEFGNLWITDQFFSSQCESFEELKFKCNNTIGSPTSPNQWPALPSNWTFCCFAGSHIVPQGDTTVSCVVTA